MIQSAFLVAWGRQGKAPIIIHVEESSIPHAFRNLDFGKERPREEKAKISLFQGNYEDGIAKLLSDRYNNVWLMKVIFFV